MSSDSLESKFDEWAPIYDSSVRQQDGFPFEGYDDVLARVATLAVPTPGTVILELGPGTGNLTRMLVDGGATVLALDISSEMLALARQKVPQATFAQAGLMDDYPPAFQRPFACIASTYTFHELPDDDKVTLLQRLSEDYLQPNGRIVIGDVGFTDAAAMALVRAAAADDWDEEFYWVREVMAPRLDEIGLKMEWYQVSSCGMVVSIGRR